MAKIQVKCKFCGGTKIIRIQGQETFICGKCHTAQVINSKTVLAISYNPLKTASKMMGKIIEKGEKVPPEGKIKLKMGKKEGEDGDT